LAQKTKESLDKRLERIEGRYNKLQEDKGTSTVFQLIGAAISVFYPPLNPVAGVLNQSA
jgi:hypothetical protein